MASPSFESILLTATGTQIIPPGFRQEVRQSVRGSTVEAFIPKTRKVAARPKRILFGVITDPRLRIKRPIPLAISRRKGIVIAHCADLNEFGCGARMSDALDDFSKGIVELFFTLERDSVHLGPGLAKLGAKLGRYVERRTAK